MKQSQDPTLPGMPYHVSMQSVLPPIMKPYYPFTGQPATYPYPVPYQYAPPPYFYLMNKSGYPQMPFNYRPESIIPSYFINR